jgi:ribose 5-phosphate isomerase B
MMKIAFANDHAATKARTELIEKLRELGHEVVDMGTDSTESVDYPDYAAKAASAVSSGEVDRAVLVCGSGVGMSMAANRYPGVRCALTTDLYTAEMSRLHNDTNCLSLRSREQDPELNRKIIEKWLATPYEGGRHQRRLEKLDQLKPKSQGAAN